MSALAQQARCILRHRAFQVAARRPLGLLPRLGPSGCRTWASRHQDMATSTAKNSVGGEGPSIIFSDHQPTDLPDRLSKLSAWTVTPSRMGIARQFTFPSFSAAWRFMSVVAEECKAKRHHPSWANLYNQVTVEWTTHKPRGLSLKDVEMAEFCDETADKIGLQEQHAKPTTT